MDSKGSAEALLPAGTGDATSNSRWRLCLNILGYNDEIEAAQRSVDALNRTFESVRKIQPTGVEIVKVAIYASQLMKKVPGVDQMIKEQGKDATLTGLICAFKHTCLDAVALLKHHDNTSTLSSWLGGRQQAVYGFDLDEVKVTITALVSKLNEQLQEVDPKTFGGNATSEKLLQTVEEVTNREKSGRQAQRCMCCPFRPTVVPQERVKGMGHRIRVGTNEPIASLAMKIGSASGGIEAAFWAVGSTVQTYEVSLLQTSTASYSSKVTVVAPDKGTYLWLGEVNGTVTCISTAKELYLQPTSDAVTCVAVDANGNAWVGHESGRLLVLGVRGLQPQLAVVAELQYPAPGTERPAALQAATPFSNPSGTASAGSVVPPAGVALQPVHAVATDKAFAWVSAGQGASGSWLSMWDTCTLSHVNSFDCRSHGKANTITMVLKVNDATFSQQELGVAQVVTGHESGAVLLWPSAATLTPVVQIGQPGSAIRHAVFLDTLQLLVLGLEGGKLRFCLLPTPDDVSLLLGRDPPTPKAAGRQAKGKAIPSASPLHVWVPRSLTVLPHRSGLSALAGMGGFLLTGSAKGTVAILPYHALMAAAKANGLLPDIKQSVEVQRWNEPFASLSSAASADQLIRLEDLVLHSAIGRGSFGEVWLATWLGARVAVKRVLLAPEAGALSLVEDSQRREIELLRRVSHPHVVRFFGLCWPPGEPPMIVTEFCARGSLFALLGRMRAGGSAAGMRLDWTRELQLLAEVAAGMEYLHTLVPHVVHGDLRSPNILLDRSLDVKISDFGSAALLTEVCGISGPDMMLSPGGSRANSPPPTGSAGNTQRTAGNPRWAAPEALSGAPPAPPADVFSFGVVMWEVLTWQQPWEDTNEWTVYSAVLEGTRLDVPPREELPWGDGDLPGLDSFVALMQSCWSAQPEQRPDFVHIRTELAQLHRAAARPASRSSLPAVRADS